MPYIKSYENRLEQNNQISITLILTDDAGDMPRPMIRLEKIICVHKLNISGLDEQTYIDQQADLDIQAWSDYYAMGGE